MAPQSKQAKRTENKKTKEQPVDEEVKGETGGRILELAKTLYMGSILAEMAPKLPSIVTAGIALVKEGKTIQKPEKTTEKEDAKTEKEDETNETSSEKVPDHVVETDMCGLFNKLCSRLHWSNPLGLAMPKSGEESLKAWSTFKSLKLDFGPRAKRRGSPGFDRITTNLYRNLPQYLHVLLVLMVLRAFLFRSFFACLPWLVGYQFVSVFLPLAEVPKLPQVPIDKVPAELRVAATVCVNGLLQLFFVYEFVWKAWFFEKFFVIGIVVYHAYAVCPADA